jgi:hypothetical protein
MCETLVEQDTVDVRRDRTHRTAIFDGREWLGIKCFLMRRTTRQVDEDHRLRLALLTWLIFPVGLRLHSKEVGKRESNASGKTHVEEIASTRASDHSVFSLNRATAIRVIQLELS